MDPQHPFHLRLQKFTFALQKMKTYILTSSVPKNPTFSLTIRPSAELAAELVIRKVKY